MPYDYRLLTPIEARNRCARLKKAENSVCKPFRHLVTLDVSQNPICWRGLPWAVLLLALAKRVLDFA